MRSHVFFCLTLFRPCQVPRWPLSMLLGSMGRYAAKQNQLKTAQNHLFDHPKWSSNNFGKKSMSTPWCQRGIQDC